jgi:hypothetical protein
MMYVTASCVDMMAESMVNIERRSTDPSVLHLQQPSYLHMLGEIMVEVSYVKPSKTHVATATKTHHASFWESILVWMCGA